MCGIVGYIGEQDALQVIVEGLERLEYRGYDSAGVAVYGGGKVNVTRAKGKLSELKKLLDQDQRKEPSFLGIGHTRWATHGRPSQDNAHPHTAGRVSLIHNGIIENYLELREELKGDGCVFASETDTEIAAHLLNKHLDQGLAPFDALKKTCSEIRGSYAFLALDSKNPDRILVAKNSSPIVIGHGKGEIFVASDIPAILGHTREITILEDGDLAEVTLDGVRLESGGKPVTRKIQHITWDPVTAQKGGFKHFMLKEIHEQPTAIAESFRGRISIEDSKVVIPELQLTAEQIAKVDRIVLVACGTAYFVCLVAKFYFEELTRIPCEVDYGSEMRYRHPVFDEKTLVIAVTQSGETADTLAALQAVKGTARTVAICNVVGSSIARAVDHVLYTHAGPEIAVASTKATTCQLVCAYLLAILVGQARGTVDSKQSQKLIEDLMQLPSAIDHCLKDSSAVEDLARIFHASRDFLFIGRGMCYPIALEGALKLKEISYIHAEGYPAGELKHGPIALIDRNMPVVVLLQRDDPLFEKTLSNLKEAEAREGRIVSVTDSVQHKELLRVSEKVIEVPHISRYLTPIISLIPLQLLAYFVADTNGTDVDLPRNLAKSVTVE